MEEMRLRPAIHKYATFWGALIAATAALSLFTSLIVPGAAAPLLFAAGLLCLFMLAKVAERWYLRATTEYVISDDEIVEIDGLWAKDEMHVPLEKIQNYTVDRSLLAKFLGVASIGLETARAERGFEIIMKAIPEAEVARVVEFLDERVGPKK